MARRLILAVTVAAAVIAAGAITLTRVLRPPGIAALVKASVNAPSRPVEARLSGGFPYRPYAGPQRGDVAQAAQWSLFEPAEKILREAAEHPTPANLHALGVAYLCVGERKRAAETLDRAVRDATREADVQRAIERVSDPSLLTDLAAAHLAVDREQGDVTHALTALAAANRATLINANCHEAMFNRALALETLGLRSDAAAAWKSYALRDRASSWAREASRRSDAIEAASPRWSRESAALAAARVPEAVLRDSQRARTYAEGELLSEWGSRVLAHDAAGAAAAFAKAQQIAALLSRITSDRMLEDEIASIARAPDPAAHARAHVAYTAAVKAFRATANDASRHALLDAAVGLERLQSPLAIRARMFAATIDTYSGRNGQALAETTALFARLGPNATRYPSAAGEIRWVGGLAAFKIGDYELALDHYRAARSAFIQNQDCANLAGIAALTAECLRTIGYVDEAWQEVVHAADLSSSYASTQRRYLILAECTRLATENGYLGVARYFADRTRAAARASNDPALECDALVARAELGRKLDDDADALRAADAAERLAPSVTADGVRKSILCRTAIEKGAALAKRDARAALTALSTAEALAVSIELAPLGPEIHLLKSEAFRAMHRNAEVLAELRSGLDVYRRVAPTTNATDRATFARVGRTLGNRIIESTIDADGESAWLTAMAARDFAPAQYRGRNDTSQALIAYHVLDDELLIWVVRGGRRDLVRQRMPATTLTAEVQAIVSAVRRAESSAGTSAAGERGYDLLVRPVAPLIAGATRLWIMADAAIEDVPFAILRDRKSGRSFVDTWEFAVVEAAGPQPHPIPYPSRLDTDSLFVIAAPNVPSLPPLNGAHEEGERVAAMWGGGVLREGADATPAAFLDGAARHDIVHFAGHITQHADPAIAALRLTAPPAGDGRVTGDALGSLSKHPPKLVVLSACGAAAGRQSALGALSLARPLFNAGVPVVIASLWDVDDGATSELMLHFYEQLKRGSDPADALRRAQLRSLRESVPRNAAVFQTYVSQQAI